MSRLHATPEGAGRYDNLHGDEDGHWPTPAEERAQQLEADRKAKALLCSASWWDETLCGVNAIERVLPEALARIMSNLDNACSGDPIGRDAITTALSQVQRTAIRMARAEVEREEA